MVLQRICVYCGSNSGARPAYVGAARRLGRVLGERGIGLVYGGGNVGLMGVLADAALEAGAQVTGVIPKALVARELAHKGVTELRVVDSMHERKALMAELADAFIGLLEVDGFFAPLVAYLDRAVAERFVRAAHREMLSVESEPERLLERFAGYQPPRVGKWLDRDIR